jgi:hypothetical protein
MHTVMALVLLTTRFYSTVDVPANERVAARRVAGNILHAAGIELRWMDCTDRLASSPTRVRAMLQATDSDSGYACLTPPGSDEVIVRVVSTPASRRGRPHSSADTLGDAYVDTASATGALATVYVDRVDAMAHEAGVDTATLLGRVMAHEIGHLLLGSPAHRASGLMRAEWSTTLIQRRIAIEWRLSEADAANAREGVLRRLRTPSAGDDAPSATVPCAESTPAPQAICPTCPVCAQ